MPTIHSDESRASTPFAVCLRKLAELHTTLRAVDGRVVYSPAPPAERAAALAPYESAMLEALAASGGPVVWSPMTPNQEALWYLHAINPEAVEYNQAAAFKVYLPLDRAALTHAVAEVVRYAPVMRSCCAVIDGTPLTQTLVDLPTPLAFEDASGWDDVRLEARMSEILHQPYDLERPGLFYLHAFDLGGNTHALMLRAHHIIADLWSLTLVMERLCEVYASARQGERVRLPAPTFPYPDYALAQRDWLEGARGEELRDFWQEQLRDCQPGLDLPADHTRPARSSGRGAMYHFELSDELAQGVLDTARDLHTTPYTLMLCALQVLYFRLTGQRDLLTGTPMHGRRDKRTRETIGYLSNMTVLRNRLDPRETFADVVERMRSVVNGALRRHDYPFPLVAETAHAEHEPGRPVLVETSFTLLQSVDEEGAVAAFPLDRRGVRFSLSGLPLETLSTHPRFAPFDLSLLAAQVNATISCAWQYSADLFTEATIARYSVWYQTLLASIIADPHQRIGELPLLPLEERAQLDAWNATQTSFDLRLRVTDMVSACASARPEAVAVDDGAQPLTYGELERLSTQIGRALRARGIGRGMFVGVRLRRSPTVLAVLLGILQTGAAYLPLDPEYPPARLAFMVEDSGARLVISDAGDAADAGGQTLSVCQTVALNTLLEDAAGREPTPARITDADPEDPAYILYTSGSTGQPKGVVVPHRALTNFLYAMQRELGLTSSDRVLALTSISFDIAALELYLPLLAGARLRIVTRDVAADAFRLKESLRAWNPTLVQATPATWTMLLEVGWKGAPGLTALCGGEALGRDLADALLAQAGAVWNMYGPTETTVWSTMRKVEADSEPVSIGWPIANTSCYVLDACGAEAPIGVPGELAIGGAGVALGYHHRSALTDERFIWHAGERVYRTGDRVARRLDGSLAFLGRLDGQIKLHGHRIELGEIESALRALPGVAHAAARLFGPDAPHRLVGYVVPRTGAPFDGAQARDALRGRLPSYMVPSVVVPLDALPLTPNQKVDRKALPAPDQEPEAPEAAPLTPDEARIAALWSELLHVRIVDPQANFFDCGGHSLVLMTMLARVQREFGREAPVASFLRQPTVARLAQLAVGAEAEARTTDDLLQRDIALEWPAALRGSLAPRKRPRAIMLTGATGFLGTYLLDALLRRTDARIYCLARGDQPGAAILRQMRAYGLGQDSPDDQRRIIPVKGDLSQADCGLSADDWRHLADEVDAILHCGAQVNFVLPYETLRHANVVGTHALLRLALEGRPKAFHFVSTFSVFDSPEYARRAIPIREREFPASCRTLAHEYGKSKWAAEALVRRAAREHGLWATIYRPGRVTGDSRTGQANPADLLDRALAGCIEMEAAPDIPMTLDMTPVDYVAEAIAWLALQPQREATYHLVNRRPATGSEALSHLRRLGYRLAALPYGAWRERIRQTQSRWLEPLLPLFTDELPDVLGGASVFDTAEVERALDGAGITCPPADEALLQLYSNYLIGSGRWPVPLPLPSHTTATRR